MSLKERPEEGRGQRQAGRQARTHTHTTDSGCHHPGQ